MSSVFAVFALLVIVSAHSLHLNSPDFPWHKVDLGPKLDAAPISRDEAGQALVVAMTMPEAYTELSALLHCSKGPEQLEAKAAHVAQLPVSITQTNARVVKNALIELLKDCIIAKAQHQHMREEIVRIISLGKAARVVHDSSKLLEIQKARLQIKLLQDPDAPKLSEEVLKKQAELEAAVKAALEAPQADVTQESEEWKKAIEAAKAAIEAAITASPPAPATALLESAAAPQLEDDITSLLNMLDENKGKAADSQKATAESDDSSLVQTNADMKLAARLANAAYKTSTAAFTAAVTSNVRLTDLNYFDGSTGVDCYAGKADGTLFVAFRGTETSYQADLLKDAFTDLLALPWCWDYGGGCDFTNGNYVHYGFYAQYSQVRDRLTAYLKSIGLTTNTKLIITGHSLGAALAWMAARDLQQNENADVNLISFATPGPGASRWIENTESKIRVRYNFVYQRDLVPCLPTYVGNPEPQPYQLRASRGSCSWSWSSTSYRSTGVSTYDGTDRPTSLWCSTINYACSSCWSAADHNMGNYCVMAGLNSACA